MLTHVAIPLAEFIVFYQKCHLPNGFLPLRQKGVIRHQRVAHHPPAQGAGIGVFTRQPAQGP
ncbi:hypothetical protein [Spirosoma montaniterrae]|uniref:hypothetical protein n=1 Tax=Spirosoma montaniterrae TaxID=1178516 RepID=UPI0012F9D91D|nr:hypothetical protein [Spirosoma montaniterrae]